VEVTGVVDVPSPPAIVLHGGRESARAWGKRWPYLTVDLFQATVDYPVQPFVLLLDPADPTGFTRNWPVEPPKEGMHLGYAIQWLAFAAIALGFYVRLSFAREGARE
jgi:surfeit locus 1 family protein